MAEYKGTEGADTYSGTDDNDAVIGLGGDDRLSGLGGDDTIKGGDGADRLNGGDGDDQLSGGTGRDLIDGGIGTNAIDAGAGRDRVLSNGVDTISLGAGDDFVSFAERDDSRGIPGGELGTRLDGGSGFDQLGDYGTLAALYLASSTRHAVISGFEAIGIGTIDMTRAGASGAELDLSGMVATSLARTTLNIIGSAGDDTITGGVEQDVLGGGLGDDLLNGGGGNDRFYGSPGNDVMNGGAGDDVFELVGLGDHMDGGDGDDAVWFESNTYTIGGSAEGGAGFDTSRFNGAEFTAQTGKVELTGFEHIDSNSLLLAKFGSNSVIDLSSLTAPSLSSDTLQIFGADGNGRLTVTGGAERDIIVGAGGKDMLDGGAGDDTIQGGAGNDTIIGGSGVDTYVVSLSEPGSVSVSLHDGIAHAGKDIDHLTGIENVVGSGFGDRLEGNGASNRLDGSYGDDRLFGGAGDDVLIGSMGKDVMTGGAGADIFDANVRDDVQTPPIDVIADFSQSDGDRIDLSQIDANWTESDLQDFHFIGSAAFSGAAGELRYAIIGANTYLSADLDGDASSDYAVQLNGAMALTAADLILATDGAVLHEPRFTAPAFPEGLAHLV